MPTTIDLKQIRVCVLEAKDSANLFIETFLLKSEQSMFTSRAIFVLQIDVYRLSIRQFAIVCVTLSDSSAIVSEKIVAHLIAFARAEATYSSISLNRRAI